MIRNRFGVKVNWLIEHTLGQPSLGSTWTHLGQSKIVLGEPRLNRVLNQALHLIWETNQLLNQFGTELGFELDSFPKLEVESDSSQH